MSCKVPETEMGESKAHLNLFRVCEETGCCSLLSVMVEEGLHRLRSASGYAMALSRGISRSPLLNSLGNLSPMPRPLCRGSSRSPLLPRLEIFPGCHGLVPWSFTLTATYSLGNLFRMPRPCAVEF